MTKKELEDCLWGTAKILRGMIDAVDFKQYIKNVIKECLNTSYAKAYDRRKNEHLGAQTAYNSGYMAPLRSTQIFAPMRSAKTSYSRGTLCSMPGLGAL